MDYLSTVKKLLSEEQDNLWKFRFRSKDLSNQEKYSHAAWDDEASRNLWTRYVYPFTDDLDNLMISKEQIVNDSQVIIDSGMVLFENCKEVQNLSNHIGDIMVQSDREQTTGNVCCDKSVNLLDMVVKESSYVDKRYSAERGYRTKYNSIYSRREQIYF